MEDMMVSPSQVCFLSLQNYLFPHSTMIGLDQEQRFPRKIQIVTVNHQTPHQKTVLLSISRSMDACGVMRQVPSTRSSSKAQWPPLRLPCPTRPRHLYNGLRFKSNYLLRVRVLYQHACHILRVSLLRWELLRLFRPYTWHCMNFLCNHYL